MAAKPRRPLRLAAPPEDRPPASPPRAPRRGASAKTKALAWVLTALIWVILGGLAVVATYAYDLPDVNDLSSQTRRPSVTILAANGALIATYGDLYGEYVPLAQMPRHLRDALLATEDRRFYRHFGVDLQGVARALVANLAAGRVVQGGSTITQQLAKNLFLSPERSLRRKVQEVLLALWLERKFTKDQVLEIYLNRVYFGAGAYGVEAAAQRYFGRGVRQLRLSEAAMLAGLLKAPSRYAPTRDPERAPARGAGAGQHGGHRAAGRDRRRRRPGGTRRGARPAGANRRRLVFRRLDHGPATRLRGGA